MPFWGVIFLLLKKNWKTKIAEAATIVYVAYGKFVRKFSAGGKASRARDRVR
jgi:hypothetical protein